MNDLTERDITWLADVFDSNLWRVHGEFCSGRDEHDPCYDEEEISLAIFAKIRAATAQLAAVRSVVSEWLQLAGQATAGPWKWSLDGLYLEGSRYDEILAPAPVECMSHCYGGSSRFEISDEDRAFIAAGRAAADQLKAVLGEGEKP